MRHLECPQIVLTGWPQPLGSGREGVSKMPLCRTVSSSLTCTVFDCQVLAVASAKGFGVLIKL